MHLQALFFTIQVSSEKPSSHPAATSVANSRLQRCVSNHYRGNATLSRACRPHLLLLPSQPYRVPLLRAWHAFPYIKSYHCHPPPRDKLHGQTHNALKPPSCTQCRWQCCSLFRCSPPCSPRCPPACTRLRRSFKIRSITSSILLLPSSLGRTHTRVDWPHIHLCCHLPCRLARWPPCGIIFIEMPSFSHSSSTFLLINT